MGCPSTCAGYELEQDIDLDTNGNGRFDAPDTLWHDGAGWTPIGYLEGEGDQFTATLNGNGKSIRNLMIDWNDADYVGLFRVLGNGSEVRNLQIPDAEITGNNFVGTLAGKAQSTMTNIQLSGTVNGQSATAGLTGQVEPNSAISHITSAVNVTADYGASGITTWAEATELRHIISTGTVTANQGWASGLTNNAVDAQISDSCTTGNISGAAVAGLVFQAQESTITRSCATGNITSSRHQASGLIYSATNSTVEQSYAKGAVSATTYRAPHARRTQASIVGGIVTQGDEITVRNSYFAGTLTGTGVCHYGGFVYGGCGSFESAGVYPISPNATDDVKDSYWDSTEQENGRGTGTGKSTREMQAPTENVGIYRKWDPRVWDFGNSVQYPALKGNALTPAEQRAQ